MWNRKPKPEMKGLSSEQWKQDRRSLEDPYPANPLTVGQIGQFHDKPEYHYVMGPDGKAMAVPNTPMTYSQSQQWADQQTLPIPGQVVRTVEGLKVYTDAGWQPFRPNELTPERVVELMKPTPEEVAKAIEGVMEELEKPEPFRFKPF